MKSIQAPVTSSVAAPLVSCDRLFRTSLINLALAGTAVLCVLASKPGHASEGIVNVASATGASSLRVQANGGEGIRVPTATFAFASADLDGLRRQAAFVSSPMASEGTNRNHFEDADPQGRRATNDGSSSTIVEPVTIAVLGFTAAALLALRRRKHESAAPGAISE